MKLPLNCIVMWTFAYYASGIISIWMFALDTKLLVSSHSNKLIRHTFSCPRFLFWLNCILISFPVPDFCLLFLLHLLCWLFYFLLILLCLMNEWIGISVNIPVCRCMVMYCYCLSICKSDPCFSSDSGMYKIYRPTLGESIRCKKYTPIRILHDCFLF